MWGSCWRAARSASGPGPLSSPRLGRTSLPLPPPNRYLGTHVASTPAGADLSRRPMGRALAAAPLRDWPAARRYLCPMGKKRRAFWRRLPRPNVYVLCILSLFSFFFRCFFFFCKFCLDSAGYLMLVHLCYLLRGDILLFECLVQ